MVSNYTRSSRISRPLRTKIFDRDGRVCVYCGSSENLSLDHILPKSLGGGDLNVANVDLRQNSADTLWIKSEV